MVYMGRKFEPVAYSKPQKRTISTGMPYTLLLRIEAIGFPTSGLLQ